MRRFVGLFRLPGEAQKIDRIIEAFAQSYCRDNPDFMKPYDDVPSEEERPPLRVPIADLAYIISFAVIMLHTDAHSREIKSENKMTVEEFVKNNQACEGGEAIPESYLSSLYERVVSEEWAVESETALARKKELLIHAHTDIYCLHRRYAHYSPRALYKYL